MKNKNQDQLVIGGEFYFQHFRKGKLIFEENRKNLFVNEGLVYALNSAFGVAVGGAPSPFAQLYIGLARDSRVWNASDVAATINTVSNEFTLYNTASGLRIPWAPQALAVSGSIELNDTGAEATYIIDDLTSLGGSVNIYGGFLISAQPNNGSSDATATLVAGSTFSNAPRTLYEADVFKVGYILKAENKV